MASGLAASRTQLVSAAVCSVFLSGCFGDPPPDPATAPLEVVMDSCQLNRAQVAPGTHEVTIIGAGQLLVTDESGGEVLSADSDGQMAARLVTGEQKYAFTCTVDGRRGEATLISEP